MTVRVIVRRIHRLGLMGRVVVSAIAIRLVPMAVIRCAVGVVTTSRRVSGKRSVGVSFSGAALSSVRLVSLRLKPIFVNNSN